MSEFRDQPKRSFSLRLLTVSKAALLISKNRTPFIKEPIPVSLSNDILKSLKSQSSINSTTLSLLNNEKFTITEADLSLCKVSVRSLSILLKHKLRFMSLSETEVETSEKDYDNDRLNLTEILPLLSGSLVYLDISCFQHSNLFKELIKNGKFPQLEYLSISCDPNDDAKSLQALLKGRHNLRFLELSGGKHILDISFLEEVPNLETLSLQSMLSLTIDEKKMVAVLRKMSKLRSVNLEIHQILSVFGEAFRNNSDPLWPQLQSIDLSFSFYKNGTFQEKQAMIEEIIKRHMNLEYIDISYRRAWDLSPSFLTSVKIADYANMEKLINLLRMRRTTTRRFYPILQAFNLLADRIRDHYNELSTDDLNEILRSIERFIKIIPPNEGSIRENASIIVQVMCSENVFRLEPQLLSRCLTAIDYTSNLLELQDLKIKDLLDYCVLEYEGYCRAAFRYISLNDRDEPRVGRSDILTTLVPKLTLATMNSLMDDIYDVIARLTMIFGQEKIQSKYPAVYLLNIIVAVTGHSLEVCSRLSARYSLQYMLRLFLRKAKSYSTKIIQRIVQILKNMTVSIDRISFDIGRELIWDLVSRVPEDRLESLSTTKNIEKEYDDDDMIDKAIWSLICSLKKSSNADRLSKNAAQRIMILKHC